MGFREKSIVGCFPQLCFSVFRGADACGVEKTINKQFCFPNLGLCNANSYFFNRIHFSEDLDDDYIVQLWMCRRWVSAV